MRALALAPAVPAAVAASALGAGRGRAIRRGLEGRRSRSRRPPRPQAATARADRVAGAKRSWRGCTPQQAAAAQAIEAAEARISAADARLQLASAYVAAHRRAARRRAAAGCLAARRAGDDGATAAAAGARRQGRYRRVGQGPAAARRYPAGDPQPHRPAVGRARARPAAASRRRSARGPSCRAAASARRPAPALRRARAQGDAAGRWPRAGRR